MKSRITVATRLPINGLTRARRRCHDRARCLSRVLVVCHGRARCLQQRARDLTHFAIFLLRSFCGLGVCAPWHSVSGIKNMYLHTYIRVFTVPSQNEYI